MSAAPRLRTHGRCDGCGRTTEITWWRIQRLLDDQRVAPMQAAFCAACSRPLERAGGRRRMPVEPVPVAQLNDRNVKRQKAKQPPTEAPPKRSPSRGLFSDQAM